MIERVARAIHSVQDHEYDYESFDEATRLQWKKEAKAAIAAMREPTEAMIDAGAIGWDALDGSPIKPMFDPTKPYQLMIDEALRGNGS